VTSPREFYGLYDSFFWGALALLGDKKAKRLSR
jgi:hypothetical protein